uniref:neugrin n=1 Tax=Pristiophorus japonicus TaxID=55135 RepID=UPI00398F4714
MQAAWRRLRALGAPALALRPLGVPIAGARAVSDSPRGPGRDWEPEAEQEEIIRAEKRKLKAIKFQRMKAEFNPSGPPPRTLTSQALQQIRFLKAKFPEEWSVPELAEGFSVSEDVIQRVLRSKFTPSLQRKMKQDANVEALTLTRSHRAKRPTVNLPSIKALDQVQVKPKSIPDLAPLPRLSPGTVTSVTHSDLYGSTQKPTEKGRGRVDPVQQRPCPELIVHGGPGVTTGRTGRKVASPKEKGEYEEACDPSDWEQLPAIQGTDEEWEKLAESEVENQIKVVQKGLEFYDQDGNFLYRINNTDSFNNPKQEA